MAMLSMINGKSRIIGSTILLGYKYIKPKGVSYEDV